MSDGKGKQFEKLSRNLTVQPPHLPGLILKLIIAYLVILAMFLTESQFRKSGMER